MATPGDRKAFRLCIDEDDRDRLLNDTKWPESIVISEWYRLDPNTRRQQPTLSSESQNNQVSVDIEIADGLRVNPDATLIDGDATVIYQPVGTTDHADNLITSEHGVQ